MPILLCTADRGRAAHSTSAMECPGTERRLPTLPTPPCEIGTEAVGNRVYMIALRFRPSREGGGRSWLASIAWTRCYVESTPASR